MKPLLHTTALAVGYGRCPVIEDVTISIAPGELVAVIGTNGSGKSTLLRTLAGLLEPLSGDVFIDGQPLHALSAQERARRVAVVLTGRPQAGLLDVRTVVSLGRQPWTGRMGLLTADDHLRVDEAMRTVGVAELGDRDLGRLSDGERQKVMIARALAQETPILLLDEPTAFLDLVNRVQLMRQLQRIAHGSGRAVLLSTHDLRTALDLADRILLIGRHRTWSGTPTEAVHSGMLAEAFQGEGLVFDPSAGALR